MRLVSYLIASCTLRPTETVSVLLCFQATDLVQYEQVEPEQMQYQSEQGVPQNWQQLRPISSADAQQLAQPSQAFSVSF